MIIIKSDQEIDLMRESGKVTGFILKELENLASWRDDIRFASDYYTIRAEKYGVISELLQSRRVFFLEG